VDFDENDFSMNTEKRKEEKEIFRENETC